MMNYLNAEGMEMKYDGMTENPYKNMYAYDYVMHEMGETIQYMIKTSQGEFCFTNWAFIHIDETENTGRRMIRRYAYGTYYMTDITLEIGEMATCYLTFMMDGHRYSIEMPMERLEEIRSLYKTLYWMSEMTYGNYRYMEGTNRMEMRPTYRTDGSIYARFNRLQHMSDEWMTEMEKMNTPYYGRDFGYIFEKMMSA